MKYTFKDICTKIGSGATPTGGKEAYKGGDYALVRSQNVLDYTFTTSGLAYINETQAKKLDGVKVEAGDVLLNITGDSVARACIIPDEILPARVNQHVAIIRANNQYALNEYLLYFLQYNKQYLLSISQGGGTRSAITKKMIEDIEIDLPNIEDQLAIVNIINSISKKIEVNQQINDNLEQQIQTLYREWFIDNPKTEWATIALSEVATFVSGYSYKGNELVDSSETAMATIKNFERNGGFKLDGYKPVSPSSKLKEEQHAELFDILVAHTDLTQNAEVIGNAEIILSKNSYSDVIFSMDLVKVVVKESFPYQFLLALLLKNPVFKSHCIGYVNGTTVLHMNKRALPDFNTQIPNCEDAARMNEIAKSIFTKMSENLSEIANLTKLRDSLLPKLMSGELKINEIDC